LFGDVGSYGREVVEARLGRTVRLPGLEVCCEEGLGQRAVPRCYEGPATPQRQTDAQGRDILVFRCDRHVVRALG